MKKIIVLLKVIPDLDEIKIDPSTREPYTSGVKRRISEVDKRALEAALRLKEKRECEVITVTVGDEQAQTAILQALAMGVDGAYIINDPGLGPIDALATSKILEAAVKKVGEYDIILAGEMSLDSLGSQVGPRLARLVDIPQIGYVKNIEIIDGKVRALRDLEDVDEIVEAHFPVLVSVVREIYEPRIPSLMNIMKAKRKPTTIWQCDHLGLSADEINKLSSIEVLKVKAPEVERKQILIEAKTVEEAANKLVQSLIGEGVIE